MARAYAKRPREWTTTIRAGAQLAFLLLNAWIGVRFYLWVRFFETAGTSVYLPRPAGVEGWLPIAALMNLKYLFVTWSVPEVHLARRGTRASALVSAMFKVQEFKANSFELCTLELGTDAG